MKKVGAALNSANKAAEAPTVGITAPAADQVSAAVIAVFGKHASEFQILGAQTVAFNEQFVGALNKGAAAYRRAEVANAQQVSAEAAEASAMALGHPLVDPAGAAAPKPPTIDAPLAGAAVEVGDTVSVSVPLFSGGAATGELWLTGTVTPTGGILVNSATSLTAPPIMYGVGLINPLGTALAAAQGSGVAYPGTFGGSAFAQALGSLLRAPGTAVGAVALGHGPLAWLLPPAADVVDGLPATGVAPGLRGGFGPLRPAAVAWTTSGRPQTQSV
ncbi:hypothetical protein BHQ20_00620 [Mycobacterium intermedium]|nr:hypothetical protein BHQ20_00620 [Mycobacterium intermedium]